MPKFRKKPIVIEAVQMDATFIVDTLEGQMVGQAGDWLITGVNGEKYPCKDEIFKKTYEPVEENSQKALETIERCKEELKDIMDETIVTKVITEVHEDRISAKIKTIRKDKEEE